MTSPVEICNLALGQLGAERISNIENPQTPTEQLCQLYYPIVRDALLESRDWTFLIKRATLDTPTAVVPDWCYGKAFQLPTDVYRVIDVRRNPQANTQNETEWQREGDKIVCNLDVIYVRYITRDVFSANYSGLFVMAFAMVLAAKMCIQITENNSMKQALLREAQAAIDEAAALDGMQGRHEQIRASSLINARNGGVY